MADAARRATRWTSPPDSGKREGPVRLVRGLLNCCARVTKPEATSLRSSLRTRPRRLAEQGGEAGLDGGGGFVGGGGPDFLGGELPPRVTGVARGPEPAGGGAQTSAAGRHAGPRARRA